MSNQKRLALINKNRGTFSRHLYSIFSAHFNARYSASLSGVDVVLPKLGSVPDSETLTFAFLSGEDDLATDRACQESLVRVLNMCRTYQHVIIGVFSPIGNIRNFEKVQAQLIEALGTSYFTTKMNLGWTSPDCLEEKDFLAQTPVFSMSILKCDINPDAKNRQDVARKHALAAFQHRIVQVHQITQSMSNTRRKKIESYFETNRSNKHDLNSVAKALSELPVPVVPIGDGHSGQSSGNGRSAEPLQFVQSHMLFQRYGSLANVTAALKSPDTLLNEVPISKENLQALKALFQTDFSVV